MTVGMASAMRVSTYARSEVPWRLIQGLSESRATARAAPEGGPARRIRATC
jgi:hypothetical protein